MSALLGARQGAQRATTLDSFESTTDWRAQPSNGVSLRISADSGFRGRAMRLDFDFRGGGGYAAARKAFNFTVPANYELSFRVRGDAPSNTLELKLVDPSGDNVWWSNQPAFEFPRDWSEVVRKKRHITFASGPKGGDLTRVAAIEIAIAAGTGGKGTVWIDELQLRPREPDRPYTLTPVVSATTEPPGFESRRALDGDSTTSWSSAGPAAPTPATPGRNAPAPVALPPNARQALVIDFLKSREFGGLRVDWEVRHHASDYSVDFSPDGKVWTTRYRVVGGNGGSDFLFLPESDTRYVRLALERGPSDTFGLREVNVAPLEWSTSRNAFFTAVAKDAPVGNYPKYMTGVQSYWTVAGVDGDAAEVLVNEEGMVEARKGGFSIEPFAYVDGKLFTWRDVKTTQSLAGDHFPEPSVTWEAADWQLTLAPVAVLGARDSSIAYLQYRLANKTGGRRAMRLYLAIRPFQVNPPWQLLNTPGGVATITQLSAESQTVQVNGEPAVVALTAPNGFGAAAFDQGNVVDWLRGGQLPSQTNVRDTFGHASGALMFNADVDSGAAAVVELAVPLHAASMSQIERERVLGARAPRDRVADARRAWRDATERVTLELPPSASRVVSSVYANLAYILVNRDRAGLQPGSRSYERSWIRNGSLEAATLLRMGRADVAREFLEWYAGFQYPNGKVPCCVDSRGADPVPEHDSHGEFIYLAAEYWRYTHDRAVAERLWPNVLRAAQYIDSLRQQRRTPEFQSGDKRAFYGILPLSVSHEGYSGKPVHSYWDDFLALRGLKDAVELAHALGRSEEAQLMTLRDEFKRDFYASIQLAMSQHRIDFIPGAADLGDFDATSTAIAIAPVGELGLMPETVGQALDRTFERYWSEFVARRDGTKPWESYTPYELRTVGSMVRFGKRDRAHALLDWFFHDQRPAAWHQWAEVVWKDPATAKLVGDMPHAGVGADYIRSVLDMFAYEREADSSLVIGAGVPQAWVLEKPGVTVRKLSTHYGPLSYTMRNENGNVRVSMQTGLTIPPGGIVVHSPFTALPRETRVNGVVMAAGPTGGVVVRTLPSEVVFRP
ncbi:MAG TPA: discoidin domain-containing protein [Gemmatimonadaceae bacterium]|nr:discoidin domain-containing protein [Gemmatimonadaceae bacterium]